MQLLNKLSLTFWWWFFPGVDGMLDVLRLIGCDFCMWDMDLCG